MNIKFKIKLSSAKQNHSNNIFYFICLYSIYLSIAIADIDDKPLKYDFS
jgi:hypothetical protein